MNKQAEQVEQFGEFINIKWMFTHFWLYLKTLIIRTGPYAYCSRYSYGMMSHHMTYTIYITWRLYTHLAALQTVCLLSSVGRELMLE